ncbi:hypothetical protein GTQ40_06785 [Flavobacteriaceae bacterium R38]|nr:hypothetical protein [Flavobacteriaceae bacterium R38]
MASVDVILFAAESIVKLGSQVKKAFVDGVKRKELVLPLPRFPKTNNFETAVRFFQRGGSEFADENPRIQQLLNLQASGLITEEEKEELIFFDQEYKGIQAAENGTYIESGVNADELRSLMTIRQWERGKDPNPTALQRVAGSLVEITVDYFVSHAEALNKDSKGNKTLRAFLEGIDDIQFSEAKINDLAPALLVAAVETLDEVPELITANEKGQGIIKSITKGLGEDINARIEAVGDNLQKQQSLKNWGLFVFKSALSSAGTTVLKEPNKYLGIKDKDQAALVSNIGGTFLDIVLEDVIIADPDNTKINLGALFSKDAVDELIKVSLKTVSEHPGLININHDGIKNILTETVGALAALEDPIGIQLLPEVGRIIIEKTAGNLESIWPGDIDNPANHLLIVSSREILEAISKPRPGGWKPNLTKDQLLGVVNTVIDEVIDNPEWILTQLDGKPILRNALEAVFEALEQIPENRLSKHGLKTIITVSIKHIALRADFLDKLPGDTGENKMIVTLLLDTVFGLIFKDGVDPKIKWTLAKEKVVHQILEAVFDKMSNLGLIPDSIEKIKETLETEINKLINGEGFTIDQLIEEIKIIELQ